MGNPPVVSHVLATSTDAPSNPLGASDLTIASGAPVYISWRAEDDDELPMQSVSLYSTDDDRVYVPIDDTDSTRIPNAANNGCAVVPPFTGCYVWTPSGSAGAGNFMRIRVAVSDVAGHVATATGPSNNVSPPFVFLAGDTDDGLGGTARTAVFRPFDSGQAWPDPHSLAVARNGTLYLRDHYRGILVVDAMDQRVRILVPTTGESTGDGGPTAEATLRLPTAITCDFDDRLLILDSDRIRRIDPFAIPPTIDTIVGGGSSTDDNVQALDLLMTAREWISSETARETFIPLPNGDLLFRSETCCEPDSRLRHYHAATEQVSSYRVSGTGHLADPTADLSECLVDHYGIGFDPPTSVLTAAQASLTCPDGTMSVASLDPSTFVSQPPHPPDNSSPLPGVTMFRRTGRDGEIYSFGRDAGKGVDHYVDSQWSHVLGSDALGECADGVSALACRIDIQDVFVDEDGQVFVIDRGRVRTIDAFGNVRTLLGQAMVVEGGDPLSARFGKVNRIDRREAGEIVLVDSQHFVMRSLVPGGTLLHLAGDGSNRTATIGSAASGEPLNLSDAGNLYDDFAVHGSTGDVYFWRGPSMISVLDRSNDEWVDLVGSGDVHWIDADGETGSDIRFNIPEMWSYSPRILASDGQRILAARTQWNGSPVNAMLKLYDIADGTQSPLAGVVGPSVLWGEFCDEDDIPGALCQVPMTTNGAPSTIRAQYDAGNGRWLLAAIADRRIRTLQVGGNIQTLVTLDAPPQTFAYRSEGSTETIFYCSTADGRLHKHDLTSDVALPWPMPSISCTGQSLLDSAEGVLYFPYVTESGMYGIAGYMTP